MEETTQLCALCDRPLGQRREAHHTVPKSKGGKQTVLVHPICHRKIHAVFTNAELARMAGDMEVVKAHPAMRTFIRWVSTKHPDFHAPTRV
ncbi:MAG: HNH endonuclease [Pseudomonadota bacterium]